MATPAQAKELVNKIIGQAMGKDGLDTLATQGLIATGQSVVSSTTNTEAYFNTMFQMFTKNIYVNRAYRNKFRGLVLGENEYGALVQKIDISMPDAIEDLSYSLVDGQSVDDQKVYKEKVNQRFFFARLPYALPETTPLKVLREAFNSYENMARFFSSKRQSVLNKAELSLENLARLCAVNFIAECAAREGRVINLVGDYNQVKGTNLTAQTCLFDSGFLRYMSTIIRYVSEQMTDYTYKFGDGTIPRFTPKNKQRLYLWSRAEMAMESEVYWNAFHDDYVKIADFESVNFWQAETSPTAVSVQRASDNVLTQINNVVGVMSDREAFGIYQQIMYSLTSHVNALGSYYNTFMHHNKLWFNDVTENGVIFTLNETPTTNSAMLEAIEPIVMREVGVEHLNFIGGRPNVSRETYGDVPESENA